MYKEVLLLTFSSGTAAGVCVQIDQCPPKANVWAHKAVADQNSCKKDLMYICVDTLSTCPA